MACVIEKNMESMQTREKMTKRLVDSVCVHTCVMHQVEVINFSNNFLIYRRQGLSINMLLLTIISVNAQAVI